MGNLDKVEIGAQGQKEIIQNVAVILSTIKGSVPLDRDFGLIADFLDRPIPVAQAMVASEIVAEVEKQEPRVKVTMVVFVEDENTMDGVMVPQVSIEIREESI